MHGMKQIFSGHSGMGGLATWKIRYSRYSCVGWLRRKERAKQQHVFEAIPRLTIHLFFSTLRRASIKEEKNAKNC